MTRPYRPSNGSEGLYFHEQFCDRCEKDFKYRLTYYGPDGCQIMANALLYELDEKEYPKEWVVDDDGLSNPRCTAFEEEISEERRADRELHASAEAAGQGFLFEEKK